MARRRRKHRHPAEEEAWQRTLGKGLAKPILPGMGTSRADSLSELGAAHGSTNG